MTKPQKSSFDRPYRNTDSLMDKSDTESPKTYYNNTTANAYVYSDGNDLKFYDATVGSIKTLNDLFGGAGASQWTRVTGPPAYLKPNTNGDQVVAWDSGPTNSIAMYHSTYAYIVSDNTAMVLSAVGNITLDAVGGDIIGANASKLILYETGGSGRMETSVDASNNPLFEINAGTEYNFVGPGLLDVYLILADQDSSTRTDNAWFLARGAEASGWDNYVAFGHDGSNGKLVSNKSDLIIDAYDATSDRVVSIKNTASASYFAELNIYDASELKIIAIQHDGTNGVIYTPVGDGGLELSPDGDINLIATTITNTGNLLVTGKINVDNIEINGNSITATSGDLTLNAAGDDIVPGDATTDIGTSANPFRDGIFTGLYVYDTVLGNKYISLDHNNTDGNITTSSGNLNLNPTGTVNSTKNIILDKNATNSPIIYFYDVGNDYGYIYKDTTREALVIKDSENHVWVDSNLYVYYPGSYTKNICLYHNNTDGYVHTSSGDIILSPTGGDVRPSSDSAKNLGTNDIRWLGGYFDNIYYTGGNLPDDKDDIALLREITPESYADKSHSMGDHIALLIGTIKQLADRIDNLELIYKVNKNDRRNG